MAWGPLFRKEHSAFVVTREEVVIITPAGESLTQRSELIPPHPPEAPCREHHAVLAAVLRQVAVAACLQALGGRRKELGSHLEPSNV